MRIAATALSFLLSIATVQSASAQGDQRDWFYTRADDDKARALTIHRPPFAGASGDFISAKQFCYSLGCKLVYQWSVSRAVLSSRGSPANSAILNRFLKHALINGHIYRLEDPILADLKEGYLIPMDLAVVLASQLRLGKIWSQEIQEKSPPSTPPAKKEDTSLTSIVLDPGHGGVDLGTSSGGILEKDVALIYAIRLKQIIENAMPGVSVTLTRSSDDFVSLAERARIANSKNAQLFISLHLNHAGDPSVEGEETYILSPDATDDDARKLALLENETWLKSAELTGQRSNGNDLVSKILVDMEQTKFIQSSAFLAALINQELKPLERTRGLKTRGVKQALFYVLSQVAMPSVLLEMGFLSNSGDRGRLMDVKFRDEFAKRLVAALKRYEQNKNHPVLTE